MNKLIYDSPKTSLKEDLFGWHPVVNRISDAIRLNSQDNHSCYTIGIYGKWGEGKTSLMNMVCDCLSDEVKINIIHFNPWLFKDQESLLLDFFKTFQNGITSKDVVDKIKKYGPLVSFGVAGLINLVLPGVGNHLKGTFDQVIDAVSEIKLDLTALKEELNESIILSGQHYLILIDDVDRLDRDELHALFKLIRQNADFVNTTYMIAMDVDMVAKSIGQRFEGGDEQSGKNFLEKIVQLPIYLPKIQQGHLNKLFDIYLFPQIETVLSKAGKSTTSLEEIKESFYRYVSPLFRTMREVVLYVNSISMILPLVYRNVNISDLCLLEALKLFHPEGYNLISQNKIYITGSEQHILKNLSESTETRQKKKDKFIGKILDDVDSDKSFYVTEIVEKLLNPFISSGNNSRITLLSEKSLCSSVYFNNYFLYTTPDDIIGDIETDRLIEELPTMSQLELTNRFELLYQTYGYSELTRVVYQILHMKYFYNISNDCIGLICVALSRLSVNKIRMHYTEPEIGTHVEFTICDILNMYVVNLDERKRGSSFIPDYEKQIDIIKTIFSEQELFPFHLYLATHMCEKCNVYYAEKNSVNSLVHELVVNRYIEQNGLDSLFKLGQTPTTVLFGIWKELDPKNYNEKVNQYIDSDEFDAVPFIHKMIYNSDINYYNRFCELFDADLMYDKVKNVDSKDISDFSHTIGYFIRMQESNIVHGENAPI